MKLNRQQILAIVVIGIMFVMAMGFQHGTTENHRGLQWYGIGVGGPLICHTIGHTIVFNKNVFLRAMMAIGGAIIILFGNNQKKIIANMVPTINLNLKQKVALIFTELFLVMTMGLTIRDGWDPWIRKLYWYEIKIGTDYGIPGLIDGVGWTLAEHKYFSFGAIAAIGLASTNLLGARRPATIKMKSVERRLTSCRSGRRR